MPQNLALRLLLAALMFALGCWVMFAGFGRYPLGFAAGCALAGGGFLAALPKRWRS